MIDHVTFFVRDLPRSRAFYGAALAPLGYAPLYQFPGETTGVGDVCGFGIAPKADLWIVGAGSVAQDRVGPMHVAITATARSAVDAFYRAALAAGGRDNGPPGLRPHYHPTYYGAFVLDPDGYNIEAVCHAPA